MLVLARILHASSIVHRCVAPIVRTCRVMATLETLNFDNLVLRSVPVDENSTRRVRQSQVAGACFSRVDPTPVENPVMVAYSVPALELLDLPEEEAKRPEAAEYFGGNKILPGSQPAAHCYCGHQFGFFAGQLGDGAAMYLGEVVNKQGERWEIQLKGAGLTPYSRQADGRKVLRSTIREFLCSEAIHNLGIPTTRAGTCVTSDSRVVRDIFYNGNPIEERCSIVLRISPTFIRFGSFEIFKTIDPESGRAGPSVGRPEILHQLLDYTVKTFYPQIWSEHEGNKKKCYVEFYKEVIRRTAQLVAHWQCVGWCHGVLNTDNMSIVGVTIDYGPFGFMDAYDPDFICNASDDGGRYTYQKQPEICKWNCMKLGEAIKAAVPLDDTKPCLEIFDEEFNKHYKQLMRKKFGLLHKDIVEDKDLVSGFLKTMQQSGADFTNCFRALCSLPLPSDPTFPAALEEVKTKLLSQCASLEDLKNSCRPRMDPRQMQMMLMLLQTQPELASSLGRSLLPLKQELERMERSSKLEGVTEQSKKEEDKKLWSAWLDKYVDRLKKEEEGVEDIAAASKERIETMKSSNPKFILRNYIAETAIRAAEKGDYSEVQRVLHLLQNPYSDSVDLGQFGQARAADAGGAVSDADAAASTSSEAGSCQRSYTDLTYDGKPPAWAADLRVT